MGNRHQKHYGVVEGCYLGPKLSKKGKLKSLKIRTSQGNATVKLPKGIRSGLIYTLRPGMSLRVFVREKKDTLKATLVMPLENAASLESAVLSASTVNSSKVKSPKAKGSKTKDTIGKDLKTKNLKAKNLKAHGSLSPELAPATAMPPTVTIEVCRKGSCCKQGSRAIWEAFQSAISAAPPHENHPGQVGFSIALKQTGCMKNCKRGPNVRVRPGKARYQNVRPEHVPAILAEHVPIAE